MLIISMAIIALSVILDQITKHIAVTNLKPIDTHPFIPKLIEFNYETNPGIAWGLLEGKSWIFVPLSTLAIGVVIYVLIRYRNKISPCLSIALAMIAGGGIGNQIDRIVNGYVVDFLNFLFINFPVFNVADCFVTVGCVLAIISVLFFDRYLLCDEKKPVSSSSKNSGETKND